MKIIKVSLEAKSVQFDSLDPGDCFMDETNHYDYSFIQIKLLKEEGKYAAVYLVDGSQDCNMDGEWVYYATEVILG